MSHLIEKTNLFQIEHCRSCPVPGYLIVVPREHATSLSQMSPGALHALGPVLAHATRLIEKAVQPLNVYCAKFGEEDRSVHFHLFPRTEWISREYRKIFGPRKIVHGPLLLDWARDTFREAECGDIPSPSIEEVVESMRAIANATQQVTN
jgi:diadenosine tetraphosphate (Ap4A) HIT family hydrolase